MFRLDCSDRSGPGTGRALQRTSPSASASPANPEPPHSAATATGDGATPDGVPLRSGAHLTPRRRPNPSLPRSLPSTWLRVARPSRSGVPAAGPLPARSKTEGAQTGSRRPRSRRTGEAANGPESLRLPSAASPPWPRTGCSTAVLLHACDVCVMEITCCWRLNVAAMMFVYQIIYSVYYFACE